MSMLADTSAIEVQQRPRPAAIDTRRGTWGMALFITTEAFLFIILFFAYFYLAEGGWRWTAREAPALPLALGDLILLLVSTGVLYWGQKQVAGHNYARARAALAVTFAMGCGFLVMEYFDFTNHLATLTPQTDAYGSIFYLITGVHAAHTVLGVLMLAWVLALPRYEPVDRAPHRPYYNVAMYWYFLAVVWFFTVVFLYIAPNFR